MMGGTVAERLLKEGWKPNGAEAASVGLAAEVVPHEQLMKRSQVLSVIGLSMYSHHFANIS